VGGMDVLLTFCKVMPELNPNSCFIISADTVEAVFNTSAPGADFNEAAATGFLDLSVETAETAVFSTSAPGADFNEAAETGFLDLGVETAETAVFSTSAPGADFNKAAETGFLDLGVETVDTAVFSTSAPGADFNEAAATGFLDLGVDTLETAVFIVLIDLGDKLAIFIPKVGSRTEVAIVVSWMFSNGFSENPFFGLCLAPYTRGSMELSLGLAPYIRGSMKLD